MDLLKIWQGSRGIMQSLIIQFVCWLGWFSTFAGAQFDITEGVTGSVNFPALAITCVGNLAVFVTSLIRGRLDLEMGARDILHILSNPKVEKIRGIKHGYGLTTCIQEDAVTGGGGDQGTASTEENGVQSASTRGPQTVSTEENVIRTATEGVPQTASTEENGGQSASTRGPEAASTEENVIRTASTEGGDLQNASTAERVLQIDFTEGEVGSENDEEEAAAAEIQDASTRKRGLQTAAVIILSNGRPNWSMRQFIKSNAHVVQSIVLQCLPLKRAINDSKVSEELSPGVTIKSCECRRHSCHCILFWTVEEITSMLASRMPGTLKLLSNSLCLLPCSTCLRNGCHECNRESLLRGEDQADEAQSVVSDILEDIHATYISPGKPICICIPMNDAGSDDWTKVLVTSLRSKDAKHRRVRIMASEVLEGYLSGGSIGSKEGTVKYNISSFVVPRFTEVLINVVLTFWFGVDGFSSALVARRIVRDYVVDSNSSGFAANAFLAKAVVKSNGNNSQVCQVLTFRGRDPLCMITFISVGCVNMICALGWALLISFEGEGGPYSYEPPSMHRVAVIIAAIGSPWAVAASAFIYSNTVHMDDFSGISVRSVFVLVLVILLVVVMSPVVLPGLLIAATLRDRREHPYAYPLIGTGLLLEMVCFVSWSAVAVKLGIKGFGKWVYGALQILVWLKWATGCYFLNEENSMELFGRNRQRWMLGWYPSAFWLNAVLAGIRCKWAWKHNHLF